jgi:hypothetical protein
MHIRSAQSCFLHTLKRDHDEPLFCVRRNYKRVASNLQQPTFDLTNQNFGIFFFTSISLCNWYFDSDSSVMNL